MNQREPLHKPTYSWHPEANSDQGPNCTRCRLYRAVAVGVGDQLRDLRNLVHACEVANGAERDFASRRASVFDQLFEGALGKEVELAIRGSGPGLSSSSGPGLDVDPRYDVWLKSKKRGSGKSKGKGKKKEGGFRFEEKPFQAQSLINILMAEPADKWLWGVDLSTKDLDSMIRGVDRNLQIPHSGYDDELNTGKLSGRFSPSPNPNDVEDETAIFDKLSENILSVPDLQPDEYPLAFSFPPLHHSGLSDSGSRPNFQDSLNPTHQGQDEEMVNILPVHHPWVVHPPAGYMAPPPSRGSDFPRIRVRFEPRSGSGPSVVRTEGQQDVWEVKDSLTGSNMLEPIYVSSEESEDGHQMDVSEGVGYSNTESGVGLLGSRINALEAVNNIPADQAISNTLVFNDLSPDRSMLMNVVLSDSDPGPDSDHDIYETDVDSIPPLAVYIPDSDEDGEADEEETEELDFGVPLAVYVPGPEPDLVPASGDSAPTRSSLARNPFTGQYTADSFANFQDDWLE
jgi:hypothetical protein